MALTIWHRITSIRKATWIAPIIILCSIEIAAADPRRVLLLHSFGPDYSPWGDMAGSFRAELVKQSPEPIDLYEASVFAARYEKPEEEGPFVEYLRALFFSRKVDLVVTMGAPATSFIQHNRQQIFPNTPLLISGIDARRVDDATLTPNDAVVALTVDLPAYINNIQRLRPKTTNVAVVAGDSPLERFWVSEMRREFQPFESRLSFTWLNKLPFDEMLKRVANLPYQSAIFYFLVATDANGVPQGESRALERLHAVASVPIFGYGDYDLGRGIVGGHLLPSQALGQRAATVANLIFSGVEPSSIKTSPLGLTAPEYDWRELRKWDISQALLAPYSIILYREPTLWEQYRWEIMLVAAALLMQSALIGGLAFEHRRRRNAEVLARRSMRELANMNRIATAGELSASIAHEMKQPLAAMVTNVRAGLRWLGAATPNHEEARAAFQNVLKDGNRAAEVIDSVRAMFKREQIDKTQLHLNDLIGSVLYLLRDELQPQHIVLRTNLDSQLPAVKGNRGELQQVVLNLVRNAADAMSKVSDRPRVLTVKSETQPPNDVLISIGDTGAGIDPKDVEHIFDAFFTTKSNGMGIGLSICKTIIEDHSGRLWALPNLKHGSVFNISLPIAKVGSHTG